jgi:hypothetical protein
MGSGTMGSHHTGSSRTGSPYAGPHQEVGGRSGANGSATASATSATGTPYALATGATVLGPAHHTGTAGTWPPKRRRLRTLALVVALAAIIGGGTAVGLQAWNEARQQDGAGASTGSPSSSESSGSGQGAQGGVPASWVRYDDPVGFSLYLPKGWKRTVFGKSDDLIQVDYSPDGGKHFVRIAVDTSPDFSDPYAHQLDLEQQLQRLRDYRRVTLHDNLYRDRDGARWEYTWTALPKDTPHPGPRRAVEETYMSRDGVEYALYMSSPAKNWATTSKQFTAVLQGWQEKTS